ncbi:hypothetical protein FJ366_01830 [Candidatus Dependentiae bacterium]|nr:hypothetical protein [Candidatus Dependentiae bacterium]
MKFCISYNLASLDEALKIAEKTVEFVDEIYLGNLLLLSNGKEAVFKFRELFPDKDISLDTKLTDSYSQNIDFFASLRVKQISILAGISNKMIQQFAYAAHQNNLLVALDLSACTSPEQGVFDAKMLDVDSIIYKNPLVKDAADSPSERWENVQGNTSLPIYVSGNLTFDSLSRIKNMNPAGVIVSNLVLNATDARETVKKIKNELQD